MTIAKTFSAAASDYDANAQLQRVVREECIGFAENCFNPGCDVLDLGSGTGAFSEEIRQRKLLWNVTQLDLAFGMCAHARQHNPQVVNASADAMPFADASFDGVFSSLMLQWSPDPLKTFREIARVLRPGGVGIIATLVHGTLEELRTSFAALDETAHVNAFADPATLTALLVHSGFRLLAAEQEIFTIKYPDLLSLLRSLKLIGASTTTGARKHGMMTPRQLKRVETAYTAKFAKKKALPATWQVLYMIMERN